LNEREVGVAVLEVSRSVQRRRALAAELPTDHPECLDQIEALMEDLPDPELLCAEQRAGTLSAAQRLRNRLDAYMAGVAAQADEHADSRVLQAGTTGTLVAVATTQNPQTGSALVNQGKALRTLPHVRDSFGRGLLSAAHVGIILAEYEHIRDFADIEQSVVILAQTVEPAELKRWLKLLADQSRPDKLDDDHQVMRNKRSLSLSETPGGMFRIDGYLDPITGANLRDELVKRMARAGRADLRTAKQRRADALAEIVAASATSRGRLGVSQVSVLVDLEDLSAGDGGYLEDGSPLGARLFDLITCTAIISVILGTNRNNVFVPLALARGRRGASHAQWQALVARDRGCIRCGRTPRFCEAHHVHHWRHGGTTDITNLVLLCSRCHHDLHFGSFTVRMDQGIPIIGPAPSRAPPQTA